MPARFQPSLQKCPAMRFRRAFIAVVVLIFCACSNRVGPSVVAAGSQRSSSSGVPAYLSHGHVVNYFSTPYGANASAITPGSDGNLWVGGSSIFRMTPDGAFTQFPLPSPGLADFITRGRGDEMWFRAESFTHAATPMWGNYTSIGKIDTSGVAREFHLPANSCVWELAEGSDGNIWFTDPCSETINSITPDGKTTSFAIPTPNSAPYGITAGPDGNLWFTENNARRIGRITPGGSVTEFQLPTHERAEPAAIAAGPDGNLYALLSQGLPYEKPVPRLLQVTPTGTMTIFYTHADNVVLTDGPNAKVWIAAATSGLLTFDPVTHIVSKPLPLNETLASISWGPSGDVWLGSVAQGIIFRYDESIETVGLRLTGEAPFNDPNYGRELGYFLGTNSPISQTVYLRAGESVYFANVDPDSSKLHTAAFLGDVSQHSAPWPSTFNGGYAQSPRGTIISTSGFSTGQIEPGFTSLAYQTGLPGFYMFGCAFHYDSDGMRTVIIVH